tara:strand:+ start:118 stop:522 length:405 start_codon:yes stop_codon:yes gene_type:complete
VLTVENGCDSAVTTDLAGTIFDTAATTSGLTITSNEFGATYKWIDCSNNNDSIIGETNLSFTAKTNGDYAVIVTVGNCSDTSDCVNISTVGIKDIDNNHAISIYPNPTKGIFTIELNQNMKNSSIMVYDMVGGE